MSRLRIAVGSCNPVKLNAVLIAAERIFGTTVDIVGVNASSGVSHQPMGREETLQGALNRAMEARERVQGDFSLGLESGIEKIYSDMHCLSEYCCVVTQDGTTSFGGGTTIPLPAKVMKLVNQGNELGEVMDTITGVSKTKTTVGATGILTNNLVDRQMSYQMAIMYAFAPFLKTGFYHESTSISGKL